MKKRAILLALCMALILMMAGCTQVTEERGMPGDAAIVTAAPGANAAQPTDAANTVQPTATPIEIPEGEKGPDEPGLNG